MKKLLEVFNQRRFLILGIVFFCVANIPFLVKNTSSLEPKLIQERFIFLNDELENYVQLQFENLLDGEAIEKDERFNLHIYEEDTLIYWTTNKLPISKFAQPQFPNKGRIKLQNGLYYGVVKEDERFKVCGTFLIKKEFSIQNEILVPEPNQDLSNMDFGLGIQEDEGKAIMDNNGDYVFSILQPNQEEEIRFSWGFFLFNFLAIVHFFLSIRHGFNGTKFYVFTIAFLGLVYTVAFSLLQRISVFNEVNLLDQNQSLLEGFSLLEVLYFIWVATILFNQLHAILKRSQSPNSFWFKVLLAISFWVLGLEAIHMCVEYSALTMLVQEMFSLKEEILVVLLVLGILFFSINKTFESMAQETLIKDTTKRRINILVIVLVFFVLAVLRLLFWEESVFIGFIPLVLLFAHLFFHNKKGFSGMLSFQLIILALFCLTTVLEITEHYSRKDQQARKELAEDLFIQRNPGIEKDIKKIKKDLNTSSLIKTIMDEGPREISKSTFEDIVQKKIFSGEWEQYEMNMDLIDSSGNSFFTGRAAEILNANMIIENHGEMIDKDSCLFFIANEYNGCSYILVKIIQSEKNRATFLNVLKSKKIPENIGFPRLLLSNNVRSIEGIENYSIAKYASGRLAKSYGEFNYKVHYESSKNSFQEQFYEKEGFSHYVCDKQKNNAIIISSRQFNWLTYTTIFSYLFTVFGIMFMLYFIVGYRFEEGRTQISLAFKIQSSLVMLVVISLILFGTGSGIFVSKQYASFTQKNINSKLNSVEEEMKSKLEKRGNLNKQNDGNYLDGVLTKFSKVFNTDLNIYGVDGYLVASSRPQLYKMGLLSEQINPEAFEELHAKDKSYFNHNENISKLSYVSAYQPIYNAKGNLIGYMNLQYFGQQKEYENQIQQFIIAIINVFILLIGMAIIMALFVSNWLTSPLRILKEKLISLELGKANEKIHYAGSDEIGMLVQAYNLKLEELSTIVQKLAATERESAWREMAKQVAHEIKNPLTPMKLSIQQLLRTFDENNAKSKKDVMRVLESLIQQIDGLANIANEFSNFAKLPPPIKQKADLLPVIGHCVDVFNQEEEIQIEIKSTTNQLVFAFDKNQWVQVFNNLLKNAIQAIEKDQQGKITVEAKEKAGHFEILISDNGVGMSEEVKENIFRPHFTTKSTGSGIGLSLVKQILDNHDVTIHFNSKKGKGTEVYIQGKLEE